MDFFLLRWVQNFNRPFQINRQLKTAQGNDTWIFLNVLRHS